MPDPINDGAPGGAPVFAPSYDPSSAGSTAAPVALWTDDRDRIDPTDTGHAVQSVSGQARQKLTGALDGQKNAAADALAKLADTVQRSGEQFQGQQDWIASAIGRGAEELNTLAGALRDRDIGALVADIQAFARRRPALFIGATFAAGFAVARIGKLVAGDLSHDDLPTIPGVSDGHRR